MTTEQNKAAYRLFIQEVFNQGHLDAADRLLASHYVYHDAPPDILPGVPGVKQVVSMFRAAFPDLKITIEEQIAEGDKVCSRTVTTGTHRGPLFGFAPTGQQITMAGLTMVRVIDGKITDSWVKNDGLSLMKQLGMKPPTK